MFLKALLFAAFIGSLLATGPRAEGKERFFLPEPGYVRAKDLPEDFRAKVDSIRFVVKDAFDGAVAHSKAERWLFRIMNKLHIESREGTIAHRLLFQPGEEITKGRLLETEKVLRGEEFLADAVLEVGPESAGRRMVKVTVYDQWTTVVGGSVQILDFRPEDLYLARWDSLWSREWLWWGGAWESNFLGSGTKLGGSVRHELQRNVVESRLLNNSITPLDLQFGAYAAWLSDGHSYQLKVGKPLESRLDRYSFATAFSSLQLSELLYFDANRLDDLPRSLADSLSGKAHIHREYRRVTADSILLTAARSFGSRLKLSVGPTFLWQDRYQQGGNRFKDSAVMDLPAPASAQGPELRTEALLGAALSVYQYDYKTARNFRNLKWNETVETGWRLTSKAALNQEWMGASNSDFWLSQEAAFGQAWRETWFASCSLSASTFLTPGGDLVDGRMDAGLEGQWKIHPVTSTFLTASWSHFFATPQSRQLLLGGFEGLSGYPSFYFAGQARFLALAEQRYFPEFEFLTFVTSFSAFLAAGNTYPSYRDFDASDLHYTLGLGLRLGRSKSTSKGVQHINVSWPLGDRYLDGPAVSVLSKRSL